MVYTASEQGEKYIDAVRVAAFPPLTQWTPFVVLTLVSRGSFQDLASLFP